MSCGVSLSCGELLIRLSAIGLSNGAVIALNAIGITLVYSITRLINFAHGDLFALLTVLTAWGVAGLGLQPETPFLAADLLLILVAVVGSGALANAVIERVAFRPFSGRSRIAPLVATIGLSFVLYQAALSLRYLTNIVIPGEHRSVPGIPELPRLRIPELLPQTDLLALAGLQMRVAYPLGDALVPLLALGFAAGVAWFLSTTRLGRALQATAQDAQAARLCGIDPERMVRLVFAIGGGLAGAAAFAHAIYYSHPYTAYGAQSGLFAFTAAVLGGIGRPWGALFSSLLLGVLAAASDYFLAAQWTPIILLSILMLLLLIRPTGLVAEDSDAISGEAESIRPTARRRRDRTLLIALSSLGLAFPLLDRALDTRLLVIGTGILIMALLAIGLNLVLGRSGLLDLGYAACFAVGAYTAAAITNTTGPFGGRIEFLVVLAASAGAAALFGLINAAITMRLHGEYLAIVTLAFGQIVPQLALNLDDWTGGMRGMSALPAPQIAGMTLGSPESRYYLAFALVLFAAGASSRLANSRIGRSWMALSMDDTAARSCGVDRSQARALVFTIGAGIAGVAGALFAACFSYIDPTQSEFRLTTMVLTMVVIGGIGSVPGAILGALAVAGYDQIAIPTLGALVEQLAQWPGLGWAAALNPRGLNFLAFGLALYLTVLLRSRQRTMHS